MIQKESPNRENIRDSRFPMRGSPSLRTVARVLAMTIGGASLSPATSAAADYFAAFQNPAVALAALSALA